MGRTIYAVAFLATYIAVLVASLVPTSSLPQVTLSDKIEHFIAYAVLAALGAKAFPGRPWLLAAALVANGIGVEILQQAMGLGRQGEVLDALANALGIAVGLGAVSLMRRRERGGAR
ncbi:MAG TPA: hypothetical protein VFX95_05710 [Caulobacteraceae bacterium]|nr:hypothetical protein [Caulobacteraceae bacterium]